MVRNGRNGVPTGAGDIAHERTTLNKYLDKKNRLTNKQRNLPNTSTVGVFAVLAWLLAFIGLVRSPRS